MGFIPYLGLREYTVPMLEELKDIHCTILKLTQDIVANPLPYGFDQILDFEVHQKWEEKDEAGRTIEYEVLIERFKSHQAQLAQTRNQM
jgi:hypothetical protein